MNEITQASQLPAEAQASARRKALLDTWDRLMAVDTEASMLAAFGWMGMLSPSDYDLLIDGIENRGAWTP